MRKLALAISLLAVAGLTVVAAAALADRGHGGNGGNRFSAKLVGFEETPSESTPGHGTFRASVSGDTIHYVLHYSGFEAVEGDTLFSHIHFGQPGVAGGVAAFLCGGSRAGVHARLGHVRGRHPSSRHRRPERPGNRTR